MVIVEQSFSAHVSSVKTVRHIVCGQLAGISVDRGIISLLVGELSANAVLHARSDFTVRVDLDQSRLRVEVDDRCPNLPELQPLDPNRASGRGIRIVDKFASAWGVEPLRQGKRVWFECPVA